MYGLKQSPRAWYTKLSSSLLQWGFHASKADTSMFLYHSSSDCVIVLVYVDDIVVIGSSSSLIDKLLCFLHSEFALKDLGSLHYFLGIKALRTASCLHLHQTRYITDLFHRVSMLDCKPLATSMATRPTLSLYDGTSLDDVTLYRSIVGALHNCTITHPDISFAINKSASLYINLLIVILSL